jgi:uncharacterized protein
VLRAEGRETRGQGNANATITAQLTPDGDGTAVTVVTDLMITGKVAQFGRGVMADVSAKLLGQFVDCLETKLLADSGEGGGDGGGDAGEPAAAPAAVTATGASGASVASAEAHGPSDIASEGAAAAREVELAAEEAATASALPPTADRVDGTSGASVRVIDAPEAEPVDLLDAAGAPVAKRALPAVAGLTVLWLLSVFLRRRRHRRRDR